MKQFQSDDSLFQLGKFGRGAAVLFWALMTLVGYLAANVFCIFDLYQFGPGGRYIPSPFQMWFTSSEATWCVYAGCSIVMMAGMLMVSSQPWVPTCGVACVMCPIVFFTFAIFTPLRGIRSPLLANVYRTLGAALASAGGFGLWQAFGDAPPIHPMLASLILQIGIVAVIAGSLSLRRGPREADTAAVAAPVC